jgi:ATP-dependent helicase HrpB
MQALPIDPLLPRLVSELSSARALVLEAPPGAGKTTRVPGALLDAGLSGYGEILVAEPRRLAARLAARRVASERGEAVGRSIGYTVRFEDVSSRQTRIRYVTEGVLARRLLDDPTLEGVGAVVLDEFHERHLATDLSLALVARLQSGARPDLKLIVMSATLEADPVARFLGDCPLLRSEGKLFPLTFEHLPRPDDRPLEKQVASAVKRALAEEASGDVLVFLPGAAEIRRAGEALSATAEREGLLVLPLHGDLPIEAQARAVEPASQRKVILSTNVAESSVTIDGVTAVVDSGLSRRASHSPWTGLPRLELAKVSRASATQRAGRAGRTRAGRVLRLYTKGDFDTRPEHDAPELLRLDLSDALLGLHGAGITDPAAMAWLDAPPAAALEAAELLLGRLGALDAKGAITEVGRRMLAFPLHPRLSRVVVEAEARGVAEEGALVAALLGERDIRNQTRTRFGGQAYDAAREASGPSDVLELVERFDEARGARFDRQSLRQMQLDGRAVQAVERARRQIARIARDRGERPDGLDGIEEALSLAVLAGFVDRVARRRKRGGSELTLSNGAAAELSPSSVVHDAMLMVAVDVEEQSGRRRGGVVRVASAIEPEWLLDLHPDLLEMSDELTWNAEAGRVDRVSRISCGSVVLDESRAPAPPSEEASRLLLRAAEGRPLAAHDALEQLRARIALVRDKCPELGLDEPPDNAALLARACEGLTRLSELEQLDLAALLRAELPAARRLSELAPERITLPGGRSTAVHYEPGKPPWIASRLQDFFGMGFAPRICDGREPLTLHLLAPNQRAVQVTSDLSGFWERHYPSIRRELMRRYPKHAWPEDGRNAKPPAPRGRRR